MISLGGKPRRNYPAVRQAESHRRERANRESKRRTQRHPERQVAIPQQPLKTKPVAQPVAGRIVPGNAGFVHLSTGRLANNT